jgi:hypothetical protein
MSKIVGLDSPAPHLNCATVYIRRRSSSFSRALASGPRIDGLTGGESICCQPAAGADVQSLHPRCRFVQRRSICQNNGVRELGTGQVAHADTPYETGYVPQFQRGVCDR